MYYGHIVINVSHQQDLQDPLLLLLGNEKNYFFYNNNKKKKKKKLRLPSSNEQVETFKSGSRYYGLIVVDISHQQDFARSISIAFRQ
jgi:hypothetical protein